MDHPQIIDVYLAESGVSYDVLDEGMWIIHDDVDHVDNIVVTWAPPIVVFRVKLMDVPKDASARAELNEALLRLNATDMISGAYGIEDGAIIATETLQTPNLDLNEFQAAIDGLTMAITDHFSRLKSFLDGAGEDAA